MIVETSCEVMGTTAHLAVDEAHRSLLSEAEQQLHARAARWTRFDPHSDLSAINAANGLPVVVSVDTAVLLAHAIDAHRRTAGRFDPTVHDALIAAGYHRTFVDGPGPGGPTSATPGVADVQIDTSTGVVIAPAGVRFDLGGIGKGHAADLAVEWLLAAGAEAAAVTIGGDGRVGGVCPFDDGWPVRTPDADEPIARLRSGGFCYSTTARRRWTVDGTSRHHIIDPTTGEPADGRIQHAAVAAATAAIAEVHATAAIVSGMPDAIADLTAAGLDGYVVDAAGAVHPAGAWDRSPSIFGTSADGVPRD